MGNSDDLKTKKVSPQMIVAGTSNRISNPSSCSKAIGEMESEMMDLCDKLSHSPEVGMDCDEWIDLLKNYIHKHQNRIYYSTISNYVFKLNEQQFSAFLSNMGEIVDYSTELVQQDPTWQTEEQKDLYRTIIKFYDHANLAHQQQVTFSNKKEDLQADVKNAVNLTLDTKIPEITKEMTSQLVGLISIFTALSFIVFGGISSLESLVSSINGTVEGHGSVLPLLILAMAWAFCMMNLLFGFMYFVIRITNLSKPIDQGAKNAVQKYPIVFLCDYVLLALLVLFSGMWFAKKTGVGRRIYNICVKENSDVTFILAIMLFVVAFGALGYVLLRLYRTNKTENRHL